MFRMIRPTSPLRRQHRLRAGRAWVKLPAAVATALHVLRSWHAGGAAAAGAGGSPRSWHPGPRGAGCGCSSSCLGSPARRPALPETPEQSGGSLKLR